MQVASGATISKVYQGLGAKSCFAVHLDAGHPCTETSFITQGISRATADSSASLYDNRRPLPYLQERRLEASVSR